MRMAYFFLFAIFASIVFGLVFYSCTYVENTTIHYNYYGVVKTDATPEETEFVRLVNQHRISIGLNPLIHEQLSSEVCRLRNLKDIAENVNASHYLWEKMVRDAKVEVDNGSHIYGNNYVSAQTLFYAYMTSPEGHRNALESPTATHIGTSIIDRRNHSLIVKY